MKLHGAAGPGDDAETLKAWILHYKVISEKLQAEMAEWVVLSNGSPNYAMSCAYASHVLAVDKNPGVHPLAYDEIWMRLFGKYCLAAETNDPARDACEIVQLCTGLQAGIEGNLHTI